MLKGFMFEQQTERRVSAIRKIKKQLFSIRKHASLPSFPTGALAGRTRGIENCLGSGVFPPPRDFNYMMRTTMGVTIIFIPWGMAF
jgi:hypothetical protein